MAIKSQIWLGTFNSHDEAQSIAQMVLNALPVDMTTGEERDWELEEGDERETLVEGWPEDQILVYPYQPILCDTDIVLGYTVQG